MKRRCEANWNVFLRIMLSEPDEKENLVGKLQFELYHLQ